MIRHPALTFLVFLFTQAGFSQETVLVPPLGHANMISSIDVSRDGKYVLTGGGTDNAAMLWDNSGDLLHILRGHPGSVQDVAFSPDGKYLLTVDGSIYLWHSDGRKVDGYNRPTYHFKVACFSPDSKMIYGGCEDGKIHIFDLKGSTPHLELEVSNTAITAIVSKGDLIAIGNETGRISLLHANNSSLGSWKAHEGPVLSIDINSDSSRILSGGADQKAHLWNKDGSSVKSYGPFSGGVTAVSFSGADDAFLLGVKPEDINDKGDNLFLFNSKGKKDDPPSLRTFGSGLNAAVYTPDGKKIILGGNEKLGKSLALNGVAKDTFGDGPGPVRYVSFSPDGKSVLCGSTSKATRLWSLDNRDVVHYSAVADEQAPSGILSNGKYIVVCPFGDSISLYEKDGSFLKSFKKPVSSVNFAIATQKQGEVFITSDFDQFSSRAGSVQIWNANNAGPVIDVKAHKSNVFNIDISPEGDKFVTVSGAAFSDSVRLWGMDGKLIKTLGPGAADAVFSKDGSLVGAIDINSKFFHVWDLEGIPSPITESSYLNHKLTSLEFAPDGVNMLVGYSDHTIQLRNIKSGEVIRKYEGHQGRILDLDYSPDGRYFISGSEDNTAILWDTASSEPLVSLISVGEEDWVAITPSGLFDASAGAQNSMYFVNGLEKINLELFKRRYFKAGLVGRALGNIEGGLPNVTKPKSEELFPLIESAEIEEDILKVQIKERAGGIGRTTLFINDNIALENDINPEKKTEFEVDLNQYMDALFVDSFNRLSIRTYNEDGWFKSEPYILSYEPVKARGPGDSTLKTIRNKKKEKEKAALGEIGLYALVVGTSKYAGEGMTLKYPDKDAESFARALEQVAKPLFADTVRIELLNTAADPWPRKDEVKGVLMQFAEEADPTDVLLVFFSGHGVTYPASSEEGRFHFLTTDIQSFDLSDDVARNQQAISFDSLKSWIGEVNALKRILIIDACNSGSAVENLLEGSKSLSNDNIEALQVMQDEAGMFILAGSASNMKSFEATRFGHGLLTYSLLNNMPRVAADHPRHWIGLYELFNATKTEVPRLAEGIGREQKPELIGRGSYPIGIVNENTKIESPRSLPVFIKCMLQDPVKMRDVKGISKVLNLELETRAKEKDPAISYWDVDNEGIGEYFQITGRYKLSSEGQLSGEMMVFKDDNEDPEFSLKFPEEGKTYTMDTLKQLGEDLIDMVFDKL